MLISAQAKAKALGAHVEGWAAPSDLMAVMIRIAAAMVKAVKTTTAGDRIRDGRELIRHPLARDGRPNPHLHVCQFRCPAIHPKKTKPRQHPPACPPVSVPR